MEGVGGRADVGEQTRRARIGERGCGCTSERAGEGKVRVGESREELEKVCGSAKGV